MLFILFFLNFLVASTTIYELEIDSCLHSKAFEVIQGEVGVVEATGKNDGEVEKYLKVVGLGKGYPYCAAGISWSYLEAAKFYQKNRSFIPFPITAGSQVVLNHAIQNGKKVSRDLQKGDFFVWRQKDSYLGHIGVVKSLGEKGWVNTIEFNTSNNDAGNQRDGGGVWEKRRNIIHPLGRMLVRGFVGFKNKTSTLCSPPQKVKIIASNIFELDFLEKLFGDYGTNNITKNLVLNHKK